MKLTTTVLRPLFAAGLVTACMSANASLTSLTGGASDLSSSIHSLGNSSNSSADVHGAGALGSSSFADVLGFGGASGSSSGSFSDTITFSLGDVTSVILSGSYADAVVSWSSLGKKGKEQTGTTTTQIDSLSFILSGGNLKHSKVFEFDDKSSGSWNLSNLDKGIYTLKIKGNTEIEGSKLFAGSASYHGSISAVAAVPEPEEWTMMLVGFAMLSYQVRRKAKQSDKAVLAG